jgi:hypothetical protein
MAIALDIIHDTLTALSPGAAVRHGVLTVVPLLAPAQPEPTWLTLAEAGEAVRITESTDAGAVPTLEVTSDADHPVLLLDGEELVGAKQNRIVNTTALLAPHTRTTISVSCVEEGRWSYQGQRSRVSDYTLYASIRRKKAAPVRAELRRTGRHDGDQARCGNLAAKADFLKVSSPTRAIHEVYDDYASALENVRAALAPAIGLGTEFRLHGGEVVGAALVAGDRVAHLAAFPAPTR